MGPFEKNAVEHKNALHFPGDTVALREIWRNRVWSVRPVILVEDSPGRVVCFSPHGNRFLSPIREDGTALRLYADDWRLDEVEWQGPGVLSFAFPGAPYAVLLFFAAGTNELDGYYINLQSPLRRTGIGFDYVEHLLDVRIPADRSDWTWKDEDELAEAVTRGLFTADDARSFRRWGERAVDHVLLGESPFDLDWSSWRPDPTWGTPELPDGWDMVPVASPPPSRRS